MVVHQLMPQKAMWIKYEYPEITFEEMCKVFGIPKLRKKHVSVLFHLQVEQLLK